MVEFLFFLFKIFDEYIISRLHIYVLTAQRMPYYCSYLLLYCCRCECVLLYRLEKQPQIREEDHLTP